MLYEDATRWCLVNGVDIASDPAPHAPSVLVVTLRLGDATVRGAVPAASLDGWKTGFVALVEELQRSAGERCAWADEASTALDFTWVDEATTDPG